MEEQNREEDIEAASLVILDVFERWHQKVVTAASERHTEGEADTDREEMVMQPPTTEKSENSCCAGQCECELAVGTDIAEKRVHKVNISLFSLGLLLTILLLAFQSSPIPLPTSLHRLTWLTSASAQTVSSTISSSASTHLTGSHGSECPIATPFYSFGQLPQLAH